MYDYIKGTLVKITAKYIVIEANGLGYIVTVANPYSFSDQMNQTIQVYLHQVIRDDAHLLFGFHTEDEKEVFLKLISVSGIGPTTALAIIAVDDNQGLVAAVDNSDIKYLMKFPKIGKRQLNKWFWTWQGNLQSYQQKRPRRHQVNLKGIINWMRLWKPCLLLVIKPQNLRKSKTSSKVLMKRQSNTLNQLLRC